MNLVLLDQADDTYYLPAADPRTRHIARVLRARPGDTIRVGVVEGAVGSAIVREISEAGITLQVDWHPTQSTCLPARIILGHPRPPVLQRLIRDLTALRVDEIHIFRGDLSEASYLESSVWNKTDSLIREGLSQGMHTAPPALFRWRSLSDAVDAVLSRPHSSAQTEHRVYGAVRSPARSLTTLLSEIRESPSCDVIMAIGPERGFVPAEKTLLTTRGFYGVGMGDSTLRTETATIIL
ncbi:MAG: RsmE family RNA methyltransferase, partial [Alkalispirochaeta sp.]